MFKQTSSSSRRGQKGALVEISLSLSDQKKQGDENMSPRSEKWVRLGD